MNKVSVIIVNKNNSEGLRRSIESYLEQFTKYSELIVVDGCSTDFSLEVIEEVKEDIDFLLVEEDNGIFQAMNKGLNMAQGDFIYFLNSGDVFYDDTVLYQFTNRATSTNEIYVGQMYFHYNGEKIYRENNTTNWVVHQSTFTPRWLLKKYPFDENLKIFGDRYFWLTIKRENVYFKTLNFIVAEMNLDGVGSDPSIPRIKIRDKYYIYKKSGGLIDFILSFINILLAYLVYLLCGKKYVILNWYNLVYNIKR